MLLHNLITLSFHRENFFAFAKSFPRKGLKENLEKQLMDDYKDHIYALIFCGGGGTRLWPFSREKRPKQFLKIKGSKTLIKQTFDRVSSFVPVERIFVVTVPDYTDEVAEMMNEVPRSQVLVEPARRNTAMAAALAPA